MAIVAKGLYISESSLFTALIYLVSLDLYFLAFFKIMETGEKHFGMQYSQIIFL